MTIECCFCSTSIEVDVEPLGTGSVYRFRLPEGWSINDNSEVFCDACVHEDEEDEEDDV